MNYRLECGKKEALHEIEWMLMGALKCIVTSHGLHVVDIQLVSRSRGNEQWVVNDQGIGTIRHVSHDQSAVRSNAGTKASMIHLSQLWAVLAVVHSGLVAGRKMTLRELWYRLKTTKLFPSPAHVNEKVLEVCAAVSYRCAVPCPREALGIIAATRGSMMGCVVLVRDGMPPQHLESTTFEIPGDPEVIRNIRFDRERTSAKCVLIVEKDSCFRRLIDEKFTRIRYPCILLTACGFPDLVHRAFMHFTQTIRISNTAQRIAHNELFPLNADDPESMSA